MRFANELHEKEIKQSIGEDSRANFIANLGDLLSQTREGIISCERITEHNGISGEFVVVHFKNNIEKVANISCDSYIAIIRDVLNII